MKEVLRILPQSIQQIFLKLPEKEIQHIEEIRCRIGQPLELVTSDNYDLRASRQFPVFNEKEAEDMLQKLSNYSLYTLEEELKRGYITIQGGHRVGLSGRVITEQGHVRRIRDVSSFNIRIAREIIGVATPLIPYLNNNEKRWQSTLIIGSPRTGKTTLLRDLARIISEGSQERSIPPRKVGIIDERSEIAGCIRGIPQNQLGSHVDVLDACPKAEGMMMMIRSMSPHVLIVDEIGRKEDSEALIEAMNAGVSVLATIHANGFEQVSRRPMMKSLLREKVFDRFIEVTSCPKRKQTHMGRIRDIRDANGLSLLHVKEF
ncbi:stage III sporulation protein AA [Terrilactibacillus sp. BCM23-1]|uniref:Stage III sporulation protein AA n=1 Tax=Terrilactibacillus tamarindi TaxID=2599694 RepID=A0A6N8CW24_9BACI|nr:stage III sporulation protein AA [Terrilactibacillus tamarindi]MTT32676.1 stage III sporulation protein AA [Terrilactibacillus tamarindi]